MKNKMFKIRLPWRIRGFRGIIKPTYRSKNTKTSNLNKTGIARYRDPNKIPNLPSINMASQAQKKLMDRIWYQIFSKDETFNLVAANQTIKAEPGHGLIYCYLVGGIIKYVGQTKKPLKSRMLTKFNSGQFGYNYTVKRLIISAYKNRNLKIGTCQVKIAELDRHEKHCIDFFGKDNSLWNIADNSYYQKQNRFINDR